MDGLAKPNALTRHLTAKVASLPMILTALVVFVGGPIWTVIYSFTSSRALQELTFVGFDQYERLFATPRWNASVENILLYAGLSLLFTFVIGFILAALLDQKVRFENTFRSIYLYPFALSFIVTGIAWQWILNPTLGLQKSVRDLGWESFTFDLIANRETVMYAVLIAGVWQGTGLVMALMLAGMRGIDDDIWKAARVDGIPKWRTYVQIVIP
ncbi:MAG: carbohydrate ABC transporter permease, partial [Allorhizobium sp.]